MLSPESIKQTLKTEANHLGFILFGCSQPSVAADFERYETWIGDGLVEGMPYLSRTEARRTRKDPGLFLPGLRTVISVAVPYPLLNPDALTRDNSAYGCLASYACIEDYHAVLSDLASKLAGKIRSWAPSSKTLVCVDTAPILEKAFAHQAGLGWIGQNTLVFNLKYGSRLLLAEILTTLELPLDQPLVGDPCVTCGLCIQACPTGALLGNRTMDSKRCLSYLTIENHAEIPVKFRQSLGNRVFGCDACQQACPCNQKPFPSDLQLPLTNRLSPSIELQSELGLNPESFKTKYAGTPVLRAKHTGFLRNLIIAAADSGDLGLLPQLQRMQSEYIDPMIQETLTWAISTLEVESSPR